MDLELKNSSKQELKWKLVKKSRSYRGGLGRSPIGDSDTRLGRVRDSSESDAEKFGEGALGSAKVESIPFKKRRILLTEDHHVSSQDNNEQLVHPQGSSAGMGFDDSGKEIPAVEDKPRSLDASRFASSSSKVFLRGNEAESVFSNLAEGENSERKEPSQVSQSSCERTQGETLTLATNRKHWDLNSLMDDWGHPFDMRTGSQELNGGIGMHKRKEPKIESGEYPILNPGSCSTDLKLGGNDRDIRGSCSTDLKLGENNRDIQKSPVKSNENAILYRGCGSIEPKSVKLEQNYGDEYAILRPGGRRIVEASNLKLGKDSMPVASPTEKCIPGGSKPVTASRDLIEPIENKSSQGCDDSHKVTKDETLNENSKLPLCISCKPSPKLELVPVDNNRVSCGALDESQKVPFTKLGDCQRTGTSDKMQSTIQGSSTHMIGRSLNDPKPNPDASQACHIPNNGNELTAFEEAYYTSNENMELNGAHVQSWKENESVEYEPDIRNEYDTDMAGYHSSNLGGIVSEFSSDTDRIHLMSKEKEFQQRIRLSEPSLMKRMAVNDTDNEAGKRSITSFLNVRHPTEITEGNSNPERLNQWKGKSYGFERASNMVERKFQPSPFGHKTWRGSNYGTRGFNPRARGGFYRTYWNSRRPDESQYQLPESQTHGHYKIRDTASDSVERSDGHDFTDPIPTDNFVPKHFRSPYVRRPSYERQDDVGFHRRMPQGRGNFRGRGRYLHHVDRSFTHLHDDNGSFDEYPQPSRQERSMSPSHISRNAHLNLSRGSSASRRISNSQRAHVFQLSRRRSRSPDYGKATMMPRMKAPFFKTSYAYDNREGHESALRGCLDPEDNYEASDISFSPEQHLKHMKSPNQAFRRPRRFDSMPVRGQFKSYEYDGPSERLSFMGSDSGHKFKSDRRQEGGVQTIYQRLPASSSASIRQFDHTPADD